MKTVSAVWLHSQPKDRFWIVAIAFARLVLVSFDLAGLVLVGLVVSVVSGTTSTQGNLAGLILTALKIESTTNGYAVLAALAIGFFVLKGALSAIMVWVTSGFLSRLESRHANSVYVALLNGRVRENSLRSVSSTAFALTDSMNSAVTRALAATFSIADEGVLLIATATFLAITDVRLFFQLLLFFGLLGLVMNFALGRVAKKAADTSQAKFERLQELVTVTLGNLRQISVSGRSRIFEHTFSLEHQGRTKASGRYYAISAYPRFIVEVAVLLAASLLVVQRSTSSSGGPSAAVIAVFLAGIFRIVAAMLPLQTSLTLLKRLDSEAMAAVALIKWSREQRVVSVDDRFEQGLQQDLTLRFDSVQVVFEDAALPVFKNLNLTIPFGQIVRIKGRSGVGKSTIADLAVGALEPTSGAVKIGNQPPKDFILKNPGAMAYVPQSVGLFSGTIRQNLLLSPEEHIPGLPSDLEILTHLKAVGLTPLVEGLKNGLDTLVGGEGLSLSGGQLQRFGLVRALLTKPKILVADEITSALDKESGEAIQRLLNSLRGKCTVIVISHKDEELIAFDQSIVIEAFG